MELVTILESRGLYRQVRVKAVVVPSYCYCVRANTPQPESLTLVIAGQGLPFSSTTSDGVAYTLCSSFDGKFPTPPRSTIFFALHQDPFKWVGSPDSAKPQKELTRSKSLPGTPWLSSTRMTSSCLIDSSSHATQLALTPRLGGVNAAALYLANASISDICLLRCSGVFSTHSASEISKCFHSGASLKGPCAIKALWMLFLHSSTILL